MPIDKKALRKRLEERSREIEKAFEGEYQEHIQGLLGLSRKELDKITPDATDVEIYDKLIAVVRTASAENIQQAELKAYIMELGEIAVNIAKRVPRLASILAL